MTLRGVCHPRASCAAWPRTQSDQQILAQLPVQVLHRWLSCAPRMGRQDPVVVQVLQRLPQGRRPRCWGHRSRPRPQALVLSVLRKREELEHDLLPHGGKRPTGAGQKTWLGRRRGSCQVQKPCVIDPRVPECGERAPLGVVELLDLLLRKMAEEAEQALVPRHPSPDPLRMSPSALHGAARAPRRLSGSDRRGGRDASLKEPEQSAMLRHSLHPTDASRRALSATKDRCAPVTILCQSHETTHHPRLFLAGSPCRRTGGPRPPASPKWRVPEGGCRLSVSIASMAA